MDVENNVTLVFNGKEEKLRLINNKIQLNAVKEAFNLKTVQLDGQLEPVDQLGFTVNEYRPGQTVLVSGSPVAGTSAAGTATVLSCFCCTLECELTSLGGCG